MLLVTCDAMAILPQLPDSACRQHAEEQSSMLLPDNRRQQGIALVVMAMPSRLLRPVCCFQ